MPAVIMEGTEEGLSAEERNALEILANLRVERVNRLKELMELDVPGVIGRMTVEYFARLCAEEGLDLSDAGVIAFKDRHHLGNMGVLRGVIGPQTAEVYFAEVIAALQSGGDADGRQINAEGLALVKEFEGLHQRIPGVPGQVRAYIDPVGIPTIGYGHTEGVTLGMVITFEEAEELLRKDLREFEGKVSSLAQVPLTENQFSALVSFAFNAGAEALRNSTLLRRLNAGRYEEAADQFLRWVMGGGQRLPGLVRRRQAERRLFLQP